MWTWLLGELYALGRRPQPHPMHGMRGVNLGGWLVLERWMTPSLFRGVTGTSEYDVGMQLGVGEATDRLSRHRESFITESHIKQLAGMGLHLLRVPVGHWLFEAEPPYVGGGDQYVSRLLEWAHTYGMKVVIDVHGAPGSQNGRDHSGRTGAVNWGQGDTVERTRTFLERLVRRFGRHPAVIGFEVLNEPDIGAVGEKTLLDYYRAAYGAIRANGPPTLAVIVHDAYRPELMSRLLRRHRLFDVVLDVHLYQLFTPEDRKLKLSEHIDKAETEWRRLLERLTRHHPILVGEWSAAMSELYEPGVDEAPQRYTAQDYGRYVQAQRHTFEAKGAAWTYWTARTEDRGVWSLLDHPEYLSEA